MSYDLKEFLGTCAAVLFMIVIAGSIIFSVYLIISGICEIFTFKNEKTIKNEVTIKPEISDVVKETDRFIKTEVWSDNFVFVDKETKVQYYYAAGAMTVLLDKDGKPLLYE